MFSDAAAGTRLLPEQEAGQVRQHLSRRRTHTTGEDRLLVTMCSDESIDVVYSDTISRQCVWCT
jgi:hypothetical protein